MRRRDVKTVIAYYYGIPSMIQPLKGERAELESQYDSLRGSSYDGTPHGSYPGKPTEELAARLDERNVRSRLEAISVRESVLLMDRECIRGCLDVLRGEYKMLLSARYRDRCSWAKISVRSGLPERTVRRKHDRALDRLGEALEEMPMEDELLARASRARIVV